MKERLEIGLIMALQRIMYFERSEHAPVLVCEEDQELGTLIQVVSTTVLGNNRQLPKHRT